MLEWIVSVTIVRFLLCPEYSDESCLVSWPDAPWHLRSSANMMIFLMCTEVDVQSRHLHQRPCISKADPVPVICTGGGGEGGGVVESC